MFGKNTKTNENSKATLVNSREKTQPSDDFRETLIKSGLDISAFQIDEFEAANLSGEKTPSIDSTDFTENESTQNFLELMENDKKVAPKFKRKQQHLMAIVGILAIIILQSVFQFSFIQDENIRIAEDLSENVLPVKAIVEKNVTPEIKESELSKITRDKKTEPKTDYKKPQAEVLTPRKNIAPKVQREARESLANTPLRKKDSQETASERLRRTEKILTGI